MKITIYELLGLIKDGKAPNHIRYNNEDWYWGYDTYIPEEYLEDTPDVQIYASLFRRYRLDYCLNKEVDIIEGIEKIPEKLDWDKNDFTYPEGNLMSEETADMLMEMQDKINNIIDILDKGENK